MSPFLAGAVSSWQRFTTSYKHISSHHITSQPAISHKHIALHHIPSHSIPSHPIVLNRITSHNITSHHIISLRLISPRTQPHDIIPHHQSTSHHHHQHTKGTQPTTTKTAPTNGSSERWSAQKSRFGQGTGWWRCAHSIKFFLWRKLPPPASFGYYVQYILFNRPHRSTISQPLQRHERPRLCAIGPSWI